MADETAWATPADIAAVWRPLTAAEAERATGLIGTVSRAIRREWPDVSARIEAGTLDKDDVADVIVWSILPILAPGANLPLNVKTYQETSGAESRSITLDGAAGVDWLEFASWMVRVFEGGPAGSAPSTPLPSVRGPGPRIGRAFPTLERWERRRPWGW